MINGSNIPSYNLKIVGNGLQFKFKFNGLQYKFKR